VSHQSGVPRKSTDSRRTPKRAALGHSVPLWSTAKQPPCPLEQVAETARGRVSDGPQVARHLAIASRSHR